jgi:hypothetical protein
MAGSYELPATVIEFLDTGNMTGSVSVLSFNDTLDAWRTANSVSAALVPDVVAWYDTTPLGTAAVEFPCAVFATGSGGAEEPPSQATYTHDVLGAFLVLDSNITSATADDADRDIAACCRAYRDVLSEMLRRRTPGHGPSLNDGGTLSTGKVVKAMLAAHNYLRDTEATAPNAVLEVSIAVTLYED